MDGKPEDRARLAKKLLAIMEAIGRVEKDKEVTAGQRFKYLSEEAMKTVVQPLFIEHGVMPIPGDMEMLDIRNTPSNKQIVVCVKMTYEFIDVDTGFCIEASGIGTGADPTDKSSGKAITNALKYVLHSMFVIPTGADPEKGSTGGGGTTNGKPQSASGGKRAGPEDPISPQQQKRMFALMNQAGKTPEDVKRIVGAAGYEHSAEIKRKSYDQICKEIQES